MGKQESQPGTGKAAPQALFMGRAYYFAFLSAAACLLPILTLYYESRGLTGDQIGVLASLPPLLTLLGASVWGGLADATGKHKQILMFAMVGVAGASAGILMSSSFPSLLLPVLLFSSLFAPLFPLSDNTVLALLQSEPHRYGRIRLWGSIGWGVAAPLIGVVMERGGLEWGFFAFIALMLVASLISTRLPSPVAKVGVLYREGLTRLLRDRRWLLFLTVIFLGGIGLAVVDNYLFLYLSSMQASNTIMGLALSFAVMSEIVIFYRIDVLLLRFGVSRVLVMGLFLYSLRLFLLSLVHVPWVVLFLQLMHGPTYALMWSAGVAHAKHIAPEGLEATAQGQLSSAYSGLGAVAGALLGGFLYERVGARLMYRYVGVLLIGALLLYLFTQRKHENGGL